MCALWLGFIKPWKPRIISESYLEDSIIAALDFEHHTRAARIRQRVLRRATEFDKFSEWREYFHRERRFLRWHLSENDSVERFSRAFIEICLFEFSEHWIIEPFI